MSGGVTLALTLSFWRVVNDCKINNSNDIYRTTKNPNKTSQKPVTTNFFVPVEQDLETQVTNTLKNQIIVKMPKFL